MAVTGVPSNHFMYTRSKGDVRLKAQAHNLSLTFGKCDTGVTTLGVVALKFNRGAGSFLTDGFCVGQEIVTTGFTDAANNGRYVITAVTATDITVAEVLVNEAGGGNEQIASTRDDTISRGAGSFITDGFEAGDRIMTNSANAGNQGAFIVRSVIALKMVVMPANGTLPAMTAGVEANLTVGTYLVKVLLMRSGFAFDKDVHATRLNIKATTGVITPTFISATKKITRPAGSFVTDGFVAGNKITITNTASNPGPFTIVSVVALEIVVTEAVADEVGTGDEVMTANDELAIGFGYTQDVKLTGVITLAEDDVNDRGDGTFPTVTWTAAGGSIGPTPGAIVYDDASPDNTILGYINFGAEETATDGTTFDIAAGTIRAA